MVAQSPPKNPTLAAALSFFINGVGQIYNGEIAKGIIIIVVQIVNALLMSVIIGFITWPIVWIWSIYDAYKVAQRINEQALQQAVATQKQCPRCAEQVNIGAQVCHFCGYEFAPGASQLATPGQIQPPGATMPRAEASQPTTIPGLAPPAIATVARFCPACGKPVDSSARFCMSCGNSLVQSASPEPLVAAQQSIAEAAPPAPPTWQMPAEATQPVPAAPAMVVVEPLAEPVAASMDDEATPGLSYLDTPAQVLADLEDVEPAVEPVDELQLPVV
jgi:TM2 domain-containing membrane protein YozV